MTEVLFYHLERQPLERVLPTLLEKSLERGWHVVVQAGTNERVEALDALLWSYRDDGFLPHGTSADGNADLQPVFITDDETNPNASQVRFFVDGSSADDVSDYERPFICLTATTRTRCKAPVDSGSSSKRPDTT